MRYEPKFDCPSRTADYGFFANERMEPVTLTGSDLADAINTDTAPDGAPFNEWLPKLNEGNRFDYGANEIKRQFWLMLNDKELNLVAMDALNHVAYELYGG